MSKRRKPREYCFAKEIIWDVDVEDVLSLFDTMSDSEVKSYINVPDGKRYDELNDNEAAEIIYDAMEDDPTMVGTLFDLPDTVEIPIEESNSIADFLSDEYGWTVIRYKEEITEEYMDDDYLLPC